MRSTCSGATSGVISTRMRPLVVSMTSRFSAGAVRHSVAWMVVSGVGAGGGGGGPPASWAAAGTASRAPASRATMEIGFMAFSAGMRMRGSAPRHLDRRLHVADVEGRASGRPDPLDLGLQGRAGGHANGRPLGLRQGRRGAGADHYVG